MRPDHGGEAWTASQRMHLPITKLLDFSSNINPLGCSPMAKAALKRALFLTSFYPDNQCTQLKQTIVAYAGLIKASNIIVGNGATEIIHTFTRAFVPRGSEATILQPTFSEYEYAVLIQEGRVKHVLTTKDYAIEIEQLLENITRKTEAIYLCNPNNPTSVLYDHKTVEEIIQAGAKVGAMVLLDESFIDFIDNPIRFSFTDYAKACPNLLVVRSMTKAFGLAGLRLGFAIGNQATIQRLEGIKPTWSVNALAQIAGAAAIKDKHFLRRTRAIIHTEREYLSQSLRALRLKVISPHANFLLARLPRDMDARKLKEALLKRAVLIRECSRFRGLDSHFVRLAIKTRKENDILLHAIEEECGKGNVGDHSAP